MTVEESLRERRKRETREQIRQAARRLMQEKGFDRLTMRGLARAAGVGLGTINLHFKDKRTLLLSTFYDDIGEASLRALKEAPRDGTLKEKLMSMLRGLYGYYAKNALILRPVVREALFASGEWKERFDTQLDGILSRVAGLVEEHKAMGEILFHVRSRDLASVCWAIYLSGLVDGLNRESFDVEAQAGKVEPMLDVLLDGAFVQGEDDAD